MYRILLLILLFSVNAFGQTAREDFDNAAKAYENNNHSSALAYLQSTITKLKATNPKIESLKALCFYAQEDYVNSKIALNKYFKMVATTQSASENHQSLVIVSSKVDEQLQKEEKNFEQTLLKKRLEKAIQIEQEAKQNLAMQLSKKIETAGVKMSAIYNKATDKWAYNETMNNTSVKKNGKVTIEEGVYTGEYVGAKTRHGNGTMLYKNEPKYKGVWEYKGQWKNDRRHGEGTLKNVPYKKGDIIGANGGIPDETYSGNWVNDLLQGTGKYETWSWKYQGNFVDGKMEGKGTSTDNYGRKYVGDWKNGVKEGYGISSDENGDGAYTGEWKNNYEDGKGTYVSKKYGIRKEGQWKNGVLNGYGIYKDDNGDSYEGNWVIGKKEGKGTFIYKDGGKYVGEWKKDAKDGYGIYTGPDGSRYDGNWSKNMKEGKGTQTYQNSEKFVGEWRNNKRSQGLCTWNNGDSYLGEWVNDTLHGKGTMMYANGEKYVGKWSFGKKDGPGILYDKENKIVKQENLNMGQVRITLPDLRINTTVLNADENYFVSYKILDTGFILYIRFYEKDIMSQPNINIYFDVNDNKKIDYLDISYKDIFRGGMMYSSFIEDSGTPADVSRRKPKRVGHVPLEKEME